MMLCIHIFLLLFDRLRPDFLYPLAVAAGHFISSIYCGQTFLTAIHDLSWPDILHLPPFAAEYFKLNAFRGRTFNVKHLSESKILYPEPFKSRAYAPRPFFSNLSSLLKKKKRRNEHHMIETHSTYN